MWVILLLVASVRGMTLGSGDTFILDDEEQRQLLFKPRRKRGRVTGGTRVGSPKIFPSFASMRNPRKSYVELGDGSTPEMMEYQFSSNCGALILDDYHVLTAAHCCHLNVTAANMYVKNGKVYKLPPRRNEDMMAVTVGTVMYTGLDVKKHAVDTIIYHPKWFGEKYDKRHPKTGDRQDSYDFAILKTKTKLGVGTSSVQVGKIGTKAEFDEYVKSDKAECQAVGMGFMTGQKRNEKLQKIRVWWRESGCTTLKGYEKPKTVTQFKLNNKNCYDGKRSRNKNGYWGETFSPLAYDKKIEMEKGDSGSPLYCRINGVWKSFGVKCCGVRGGGDRLGGFGFWGVPFSVIDWIVDKTDYQAPLSSSSPTKKSSPKEKEKKPSSKKKEKKSWKWGYQYYFKYYYKFY